MEGGRGGPSGKVGLAGCSGARGRRVAEACCPLTADLSKADQVTSSPASTSRCQPGHAPGLQNWRPPSRSAACELHDLGTSLCPSLPPFTDKIPEATRRAARRKRFINGAWDRVWPPSLPLMPVLVAISTLRASQQASPGGSTAVLQALLPQRPPGLRAGRDPPRCSLSFPSPETLGACPAQGTGGSQGCRGEAGTRAFLGKNGYHGGFGIGCS